MSKKLSNTTALQIKCFPWTNTLPHRLKFTQTNNNKSIMMNYPDTNMQHDEFCEWILEQLPITYYQLLIDNTQIKHYTYVLQFPEQSIPDFLTLIKQILS